LIETIHKCRVCDNKKIIPFFDLGEQPLANSLLSKQFEKEKQYPLSLSWCSECNLVQLNHTVNPKVLFSNYVWVTSTSSYAKKYAELFCQNLIDELRISDNRSYVLEIASNDGTFLKPFINKGFAVLGVDPANNIVEIAKKDSIPSLCGFWNPTLANEIISDKGYPSIIFARNVLPHVADLNNFVEAIRIASTKEAILAFEVHYAGKILNELHYDSIYHEHLCYFSLKSLERILNKHDIYIFDLFESPISGGSIVVLAGTYQREKSKRLTKFEETEIINQINDYGQWEKFSRSALDHKKKLTDIFFQEISNGATICGYGASARSSTMLNFCKLSSVQLKMIADQNPMKHNKYTSGSNILITTPEIMMQTNPDVIIVLAWNFLQEICNNLIDKYNYTKKIIIPFPYPPRIIALSELVNTNYLIIIK